MLLVAAGSAGSASAAVHPFLAPAHGVCQSMLALQKAITPTVTAAQLPKLEATATAVLAKAQKLVAAQGAPALTALELVLTHIKRGMVANRVTILTQTLATARAAVWAQAKKDRLANPFAALRGFRAVAPGIVARRGSHRGLPAWFVAADLAQPRIRLLSNGFRMNGSNYASVRVADSARARGAQAAINGDFFSNVVPRYRPSGYTQTSGVVWPGTDNPRFEPSVIWAGQHVAILPKRERVPKWASHVVSARPMTLQGGKVVTDFGGDASHAGRSRRTGVGLSKSGRVLFFVASPSATASEVGQLLKSVGAHDGFTMDGGGSAQLYLKGHGYAQPSSDGPAGRAVSNLLMVRYK